jgi:hypothetical protein
MLANLLISLVRSKVKRQWAFSNLVSVIRQQLMSYINIYRFLENSEACWEAVINLNYSYLPKNFAAGSQKRFLPS